MGDNGLVIGADSGEEGGAALGGVRETTPTKLLSDRKFAIAVFIAY